MALKDEVTRQARQLEGMRGRLDSLETNQSDIIKKLDAIASKLSIAKDTYKIVYESTERFPWRPLHINTIDDTKMRSCYARLSEEEYQKFNRGYENNKVTVEIIEDASDRFIDKLLVRIDCSSVGRRLSISNVCLTPASFVRMTISSDGTRRIVKDKQFEYESSKSVPYDTGKKYYKIAMTKGEYELFRDHDVEFVWGTLVDARTKKELQVKQFYTGGEGEFNSDGVTFTIEDFKPIAKKIEDDYCTENENYEFADGTKLKKEWSVGTKLKEEWITKLKPSDIEYLYKEYGYDKWLKEVVMPHKNVVDEYDDGEHLEELQKKDNWDEDTEKSDNMYVKLANLIAWFDIDKIARNIVRVNNATNGDKIESANIVGTNFTSVRSGLYSNIKECVESFIRWTNDNELDESHNIFEQQVGRIHFMAMFNSIGDEPDEKWTSYKLYWTDEETDEGEE